MRKLPLMQRILGYLAAPVIPFARYVARVALSTRRDIICFGVEHNDIEAACHHEVMRLRDWHPNVNVMMLQITQLMPSAIPVERQVKQ